MGRGGRKKREKRLKRALESGNGEAATTEKAVDEVTPPEKPKEDPSPKKSKKRRRKSKEEASIDASASSDSKKQQSKKQKNEGEYSVAILSLHVSKPIRSYPHGRIRSIIMLDRCHPGLQNVVARLERTGVTSELINPNYDVLNSPLDICFCR